MEQVGDLLENLAQDLDKYQHIPTETEAMIKKELGRIQVSVRNPIIYQDRDGHREIHIYAATAKGRLVTAKAAAEVLSRLFGSPFMPSRECHHVIGRREVPMVFVENTSFYALTGVARMAKEGQEVSGDTFSCLSLPNGELLLALSDGMGSGEEALEESRNVIELLEQMTEAGFSKISALKLINCLYMPESAENGFATADVVVVNLYQGNCRFIKNGAAATWIWRGNGLERIEGQALPVGIWQEADPYLNKTHISSGDYVIMVTDGIVDAFQGREQELEEILSRKKIINPQELAEYILDEAVKQSGGFAEDDMSVVAAGIWARDTSAALRYKRMGRKHNYHETEILSQGETVL
jgi:stage II sporulation protein E